MNIFQSIILGIVQGLTEFIPVSSTAHLLIVQKLMNIEANDFIFSFLVIVQLGTIISLIVYFWNDLITILQEWWSSLGNIIRRRKERVSDKARVGWYIILATIPGLLAGYLLKDIVKILFKTPLTEAGIRLFVTAIILTLAEWLSKPKQNIKSMNWKNALIVGIAQIISVFPGASRSGTTISAGMGSGLDRASSARFAFLISIPIMIAAGTYQVIDVVQTPGLGASISILLIGTITASIVGWLAIKWLMNYLSKRSLYIFAIYCTVLSLVAFGLQYL